MMDEQTYLYKIQPIRTAMLSTGPTPDEEAIIEEHISYLEKLAEYGVIHLAGRTLTTDERSFGIVIFEAPSDEDAWDLIKLDPAIKSGMMTAELFPFRIAVKAPRQSANE